MIINFNKKIRKVLAIFGISIVVLSAGGIYFKNINNDVATINTVSQKSMNRYTIDVVFEDESKRLMCNQNIEYINNTKDNLDKIYFHIYPNAFSKREFAPFEKGEIKKAYPNGFNEGYIDIKNIINNNKKLSYKIIGDKNDILEITLDKPLEPESKVSIDMKYNVKIPNSEGRFGYGDNTINITNWFPIACVNDDRGWNLKSYETVGDPFYSETSDFYVKMLLPSKYQMGSTGKVVKKTASDEKVLYEVQAKKVRDFAFVMSDKFNVSKDKYKDIEISTYNLNEKLSKDATEVAKDSIKIFSDIFGDYPYDTYSVMASDFFIGGMEYPTLIMIDQTLYTEEDKFLLEYVIAHETAHQWWYSVIGNDEISEPWIDEALTEYSTILYFEKKYGKDMGERLLKTMEVQTKNHSSENIFKATTDYRNSIDYSLNVYTKGALAFNEVRESVGDEVFFSTLKEYYSTYMYQNVNSAKFVDMWNSKGVDIDKIIREYK